jgi:Zn-dependent protease with chaperone function
MDFFAAQDRAKRSTVLLVFLYMVAIIGVVVATDAAVSCVTAIFIVDKIHYTFEQVFRLLLPYIGGVVTVIVVGATVMKANEIGGNGTKIGDLLGARWLNVTPTVPSEIRFKNVVEEMALAAGVRPPRMCILDKEMGINAFAAGTNNVDAVIGVTAGCLGQLSRDELQAIVAHEFSHILNNDTLLNTRAFSMVFGLLAISTIGSGMLTLTSEVSSRDTRNSNSGGVSAAFFILGLILVIVGSIGAFAGRVLRAAIARQREYLADAAAVQYTRNADAVASALYKMATAGSHLKYCPGEEVEHFLFGAGSSSHWGRIPVTRAHPPAPKRILAVRPGFQPVGSKAVPVSELKEDDDGFGTAVTPWDEFDANNQDLSNPEVRDLMLQIPGTGGLGGVISGVIAAHGTQKPPPKALMPLREAVPPTPAFTPPPGLVSALPPTVRSSATAPESAAAVCFAIAAANQPPAVWTPIIAASADASTAGTVKAAVAEITPLAIRSRMALLDAASVTAQSLRQDEVATLVRAVDTLVASAKKADLATMAVYWRLNRITARVPQADAARATWTEGSKHIAVLITYLARLQYGTGVQASNAYAVASRSFASLGALPPMPRPGVIMPQQLPQALNALAGASDSTRDVLVETAADLVIQAQIPQPGADTLLRIICDAANRNVPEAVGRWV